MRVLERGVSLAPYKKDGTRGRPGNVASQQSPGPGNNGVLGRTILYVLYDSCVCAVGPFHLIYTYVRHIVIVDEHFLGTRHNNR